MTVVAQPALQAPQFPRALRQAPCRFARLNAQLASPLPTSILPGVGGLLVAAFTSRLRRRRRPSQGLAGCLGVGDQRYDVVCRAAPKRDPVKPKEDATKLEEDRRRKEDADWARAAEDFDTFFKKILWSEERKDQTIQWAIEQEVDLDTFLQVESLHKQLGEVLHLKAGAVARMKIIAADLKKVQTFDSIISAAGFDAGSLLKLASTLKERRLFGYSVHNEPGVDVAFVSRAKEAEDLVAHVSAQIGVLEKGRELTKQESALLEYATISGAGKSRWGFEVERVLRSNFPNACVSRVALNFNGGTSGGGADGTEAAAWSKMLSPDQVMAGLLFARGLLQCAPDRLRGHEAWLKQLSSKTVIDALFDQALFDQAGSSADKTGCQRLLEVHVDELAMLMLVEVGGESGGDKANARQLKNLVNPLANYNCSEEAKGLVIPIITHTAPVQWEPVPTQIPINRVPLPPFNFQQSCQFLDGIETGIDSNIDARRVVSACGGHAGLLVELRSLFSNKSATLGALCASVRVQAYRTALSIIDSAACQELVNCVLLQKRVKMDDHMGLAQRGLVFVEPPDVEGLCRLSVPYPMLLCLLQKLTDPDRFKPLIPGQIPGKHGWSAKAFEHACALRIASEFADLPYIQPSDASVQLRAHRGDGKPRVFLRVAQNAEAVDVVGVGDGILTLVQCKYPEKSNTYQEAHEINMFRIFIETSGVEWAILAGCNTIRAVFATGRTARDYQICSGRCSTVGEVQISFTLYAKNQNSPQDGQMQSVCIDTWLSPGILCV